MGKEEHPGERSIGRRIHVLDRWMRLYIADELDDIGVGPGQFPFLMTLYHGDGRTQEELTKAVNVDKATTTRAVRKLVKEGYVRKEQDPQDRRANRIYLTDKAKKIRPKLRRTLRKWTELLTEDLTKEEEETLRKLLDKMTANAPKRGASKTHRSSDLKSRKATPDETDTPKAHQLHKSSEKKGDGE